MTKDKWQNKREIWCECVVYFVCLLAFFSCLIVMLYEVIVYVKWHATNEMCKCFFFISSLSLFFFSSLILFNSIHSNFICKHNNIPLHSTLNARVHHQFNAKFGRFIEICIEQSALLFTPFPIFTHKWNTILRPARNDVHSINNSGKLYDSTKLSAKWTDGRMLYFFRFKCIERKTMWRKRNDEAVIRSLTKSGLLVFIL